MGIIFWMKRRRKSTSDDVSLGSIEGIPVEDTPVGDTPSDVVVYNETVFDDKGHGTNSDLPDNVMGDASEESKFPDPTDGDGSKGVSKDDVVEDLDDNVFEESKQEV